MCPRHIHVFTQAKSISNKHSEYQGGHTGGNLGNGPPERWLYLVRCGSVGYGGGWGGGDEKKERRVEARDNCDATQTANIGVFRGLFSEQMRCCNVCRMISSKLPFAMNIFVCTSVTSVTGISSLAVDCVSSQVTIFSDTFFFFKKTNQIILILDFRLSTWNEYWLLVLGSVYGVRGKFPDHVPSSLVMSHDSWPVKMGSTAVSETSSENSPRTPYKNPKTKDQFLFYLRVINRRNMR
jgi:hypothetical protein